MGEAGLRHRHSLKNRFRLIHRVLLKLRLSRGGGAKRAAAAKPKLKQHPMNKPKSVFQRMEKLSI